MPPPDALETLRQVNENLRSALHRLRPEQRDGSTIGPREFSAILSQLLRAAECLRCRRPHSDGTLAFDKEPLEYRNNLEELKDFLPEVHARLLAEKSRLETARNHLAAATAWSRASKQTL